MHASPDALQRQRYEDSYRAEGRDLAAVTILSTAYDEPWFEQPVPYVGAETLLDVLHAGRYTSDVLTQYVQWLEHVVQERRDAMNAALSSDAEVASVGLESGAAQWEVMRRLGNAIGGPSVARLNTGANNDGSRWTQLRFSPGGPPAFDALFYRLESWAGSPAQFTLRQYQKPADPEKPVRLAQLRGLFRDAIGTSAVPFDTAPRGAPARGPRGQSGPGQRTARNHAGRLERPAGRACPICGEADGHRLATRQRAEAAGRGSLAEHQRWVRDVCRGMTDRLAYPHRDRAPGPAVCRLLAHRVEALHQEHPLSHHCRHVSSL